MENNQIRVAVVGCCHGELDEIYKRLTFEEQNSGLKIDLLLICGDFQAVRNYGDLEQMAVPYKYRKLNTFYKYYSGEVVAPVLTIFIGGNHEASGFLQELPYGGWVAPNIYYLGYSGVIQFGGLRIAGISGIYKEPDFNKGHYEKPPYDKGTIRSCYHVRALDVYRMHHIKQDVDIFLSHDWPLGIYHHGNTDNLLRNKPFFYDEISRNTLGNPHTMGLLRAIQPRFWFAAHLHCHFKATVIHGQIPHHHQQQYQPQQYHHQQQQYHHHQPQQYHHHQQQYHHHQQQYHHHQQQQYHHHQQQYPQQNYNQYQQHQQQHGMPLKTTEFCALDKVIPGRRFFEIFVVSPRQELNQPKKLHYDAEWLTILTKTDHFMSLRAGYGQLPQGQPTGPTNEEVDSICKTFETNLSIPENFTHTSPPMEIPHDPIRYCSQNHHGDIIYVNPQTERLSQLLGIVHPNKEFSMWNGGFTSRVPSTHPPNIQKQIDPNEININGVDDDNKIPLKQSDPNEIHLDDDDDDKNICIKQSDPC